MSFHKRCEIKGHAAAIYCGDFDSDYLYSGSADQFITRWDINLGVQDKFAIRMNQSVYALQLISNKLLIAGLSSGAIHVFDLINRVEIKHFTQHIKGIFCLAFNDFKNHFYAGDSDGNLSIWNAESLELLLYLPLNVGKIRKLNSSLSGDRIVLSCQDGSIRVFETNGYNEIHTIEAHKNGATVSVFNPLNENQLISGGKDALLKVWNLENLALLQEIPAHNYVIYDICFQNQNSHFVTSSRDKTIKIWNTIDYSFKQRLDFKDGGHRHSVNSLVKINDHSFASLSDDKKIVIWEDGNN
jgi:WD40 repeat protein